MTWTFFANRQLHQRPCQARHLPTAEAGDVLPAHHRDGQWPPPPEQHQHPDHPRVRLQQGGHRAVLQRGGLRPAHRSQHGCPYRHPGLHLRPPR